MDRENTDKSLSQIKIGTIGHKDQTKTQLAEAIDKYLNSASPSKHPDSSLSGTKVSEPSWLLFDVEDIIDFEYSIGKNDEPKGFTMKPKKFR